ncbi:MAG: uroporphyrinogen decarboxylase family protein [Bacillota bacterium]
MELKLDLERLAIATERRIAFREDINKPFPFIFQCDETDWGAWIPGCPYNFKEMIEDPFKAAEGQIISFNNQHSKIPSSDWLPVFRTHFYGEGYVPSMFGASQVVVENNPPFTEGRVMETIFDVEKLPEKINPHKDGWGPIVREGMLRMAEAGQGIVPVGITDHQSPYGIATKLLGNEDLMLAMYDEPELVHKLMRISTDALIDVIEATKEWIGEENLALCDNHPVRGSKGLILWDDYISVLSPTLYDEFCLPYNLELYKMYGRGHLHTCGPYFPNYFESIVKNSPVTIDISIMRDVSKSKEDILELRKITRENGIVMIGGLQYRNDSIFDTTPWTEPDIDFLREMSNGGLIWVESTNTEKYNRYLDMYNSL